MIRSECYDNVGLYDERYAQLPDFDFWIRLCLKYDIHILPENLIKFRVFSDMQNASGSTPENKVRIQWERRHILENYLNIREKKTLLRVFPETSMYGNDFDDTLIPFIVAKLALKHSPDNKFAQSFALDTIANLLRKPIIAQKLEFAFGFTYRDFIEMTGHYDVYNNRLIKEIKKIKKHPVKYLLGIR
jgi:hypothetical protein